MHNEEEVQIPKTYPILTHADTLFICTNTPKPKIIIITQSKRGGNKKTKKQKPKSNFCFYLHDHLYFMSC